MRELLAGGDFHLGALCHEFEGQLAKDRARLPVFCGDLVNRPGAEGGAFFSIMERWTRLRPDLVVVPGNHDPEPAGAWEGVRVVDRGPLRLLLVPLIPILYKIPAWTHEVSEASIAGRVAPFRGGRYDVVVSHAPPHGVVDRIAGGRHAGSRALADLAEEIEFRLWICAHVHEQGGREGRIAGRPVWNVARRIARVPLPGWQTTRASPEAIRPDGIGTAGGAGGASSGPRASVDPCP